MKRSRFLLLLLTLPTVLAGCTNSERFGRLSVATDLSTRYTVILQSQRTQQTFIEIARSPVPADGRVIFLRLPPGEYRLEVRDNLDAVAFTSPVFGVSTNGDSDYTLTTSLPP